MLIVYLCYQFSKKSIGDDQNIPFRDVLSMTAYIPQVKSASIAYPLLVCNIDDIICADLFEWEDPNRGYDYYDVTKDVDKLLREESQGNNNTNDNGETKALVFSRVMYWPYCEEIK